MANMHYCAFQNTHTDLKQCVQILKDFAWHECNISPGEFSHAEEMIEVFKKFEEAYNKAVKVYQEAHS